MSIAQSQVYDRAYLERPLPVFGEDLLRRFDAFILDDSLYGEYAVRQRLIKRCVPKRLYSVALEALSKGGTALSTDNAAVVVEVIEIPQHLSILSHPGANFDKLSGSCKRIARLQSCGRKSPMAGICANTTDTELTAWNSASVPGK